MPDPVYVIPEGSIDFVLTPVLSNGEPITSNVKVSVVPAGQPHGTWKDATILSGKAGVLVNGSELTKGSYWVWAQVTANPQVPIVLANRFTISSTDGWNYNAPVDGSYGTDTISELRFLVKDTTYSSASLSDDEVRYFIARWRNANPGVEQVNVLQVAAAIAYSMADSYVASAKVSKSVGDTTISREYGGEAERYRELAKRLTADAGTVATTSSSLAGMGLAYDDGRDPIFSIGHMDSGSSWYGR